MHPSLKAGDEVDIYDKSANHVGQIRLETFEYSIWSGPFSPGPAFGTVRDLFRERVALAEKQLSVT